MFTPSRYDRALDVIIIFILFFVHPIINFFLSLISYVLSTHISLSLSLFLVFIISRTSRAPRKLTLSLSQLEGHILKKLVDAMKDLITDANIDVSNTGMSLQAMDSSHVSLCSVLLRADGFDHYRADRTNTLGLNFGSLSKILKCAGNDDIITMKAEDEGDSINFMFETKSQDRISDFEMKLMDIDSEHLGIPGQDYKVVIQMPSAEFQRICRDMQVLGEICVIKAEKGGVKFSVSGDIGVGHITRKPSSKDDEKDEEKTVIDIEEPLELSFALRYLSLFTKATPLSPTVTLKMSPEVPLVVEYPIGDAGHIRYYLAPKIDEEEEDEE